MFNKTLLKEHYASFLKEMLVEITLQVEADRPIRKMSPVSPFSFNIFKHSFNIFKVNFLNGMPYIVTKKIG
jgi:hypothetical protein